MKKSILTVLFLFVSAAAMGQNQYVNPMIGTGGMGHTFPGACYPYGFVQLSPDTDTIPHNINGVYQPRVYDYCAGYQYRDSSIVGFSHTHFSGTGHSDLGDILIMPYTGETRLNPGTADNPDGGYRQRFRHETEQAEPGYYTVLLDDDSIRCELTATPHCGVHRYIFPKGRSQKIILDLNHSIYNYDGKVLWAQCNVKGDQHLQGWRITSGWSRTHQLYYYIYISKPIRHYGYHDFGNQPYKGFWHRFDVEHDFPEIGGRKVVCWFDFGNEKDNSISLGQEKWSDTLEIIVGLSAVSVANAREHAVREGMKYHSQASRSTYVEQSTSCRYKYGETELTVNEGDPRFKSNFDVVRELTRIRWQKMLSRIETDPVASNSSAFNSQLEMLYTSLYHTMINPSIYQDYNGQYRTLTQSVATNEECDMNYTVFSLWDTYRALHPLINLLDTAMSRHVATSLLNHFDQSPHGMLPVWSHHGSENWCMIGYHGVSVLVDAALNTLKPDNEDDMRTGTAILSSSNVSYYDHTDLYKKLGYVPVDKSHNGTSVTLENAYEDWCIYYAMKKGLDMLIEDVPGLEDSIRENYRQRALNYRNVFKDGFARARYSDGSWKTPYSLLSTSGEGFIEGNSWNYSFYVPHDVDGLMQMMGGERAFVRKLDTLFTMYIPDEFFAETEDVTREGMLGGYVHGNEPSHHIPYLYMWTTEPWKTQYWVREIMNRMYGDVASPDTPAGLPGLCGNDDCGQMSAWYVFSAMGFYPVCPASGQYILGAPYLPYMKVRMGSGNYLEIKAPNVSDRNRYIRSVRLNGKPLTRAYLTYEELQAGGVLEFDMASKPNKKLFQSPESKPYSLSKE